MSKKRMPTHKEAIEKRNKIIKVGFKLMCTNGYYNTNTRDIATAAEVSTGIIYQYFNNKKDIFVEGVKQYSNSIIYPMINVLLSEKINNENFDSIIKKIINKFVENHTITKKEHEQLIAMSHLDNDIGEIFKNNEISLSEQIVNYLKENNISSPNIHEKVHIIIGMVNNYCHEVVYHKHNILNYDSMEKELIRTIKFILEIKR